MPLFAHSLDKIEAQKNVHFISGITGFSCRIHLCELCVSVQREWDALVAGPDDIVMVAPIEAATAAEQLPVPAQNELRHRIGQVGRYMCCFRCGHMLSMCVVAWPNLA